MRIKANLFCITQAGEPTCVALTQVGRTKVLVTAVGNPGDGPVVIRFGDAVATRP
jgi:hypothetical protein